MNFTITVQNKVAIAVDPPEIICGNSDYVIDFVFDKEWEEYEVKVAVFTFKRDGRKRYIEQVFMGTQCEVPVLTGIDEVTIGVYTGNLETTTGATVKTKKSVLCDVSKAEDPHNDVFCQLLEILKDHYPLKAIEAATKAAQVAIDAASGVEIVEQNHKCGLTFWVGTQEEYNKITTISQKCFYIITDDKTQQELEQAKDIVNDCLKAWNVDDELIAISPKINIGVIFTYDGDSDAQNPMERQYKIISKHHGKIRVKFSCNWSGHGSADPILQLIIKCNDETVSDNTFSYVQMVQNEHCYDIDVNKGINKFSIRTVFKGIEDYANSENVYLNCNDFHLCANYDTPFVYISDDFLIEEE